MTLEKDGSAQSGYVEDLLTQVSWHVSNGAPSDGLVWRYGTERPCNLVGRYVTIFADYSAVSKPSEIALCSFGIMGNRTPVPDEVIVPEFTPPTFAEEL